ncbi:DUF488 domain-containing protein [Actinomadura miaoliensis]|uniref:DUF488 family protein n=1 Tax=Actinomadura miaoliensis TaxID=430685 RepID=A0ABP7WHZ5_9ACTN
MSRPAKPRVRRAYDEPEPQDGTRVLVDRLWPRGLSKDSARIDEWLKDVAPSTELRRWYGHDPSRYDEFCRRYEAELADEAHTKALDHLRELAASGPLTLLTATKDMDHSQVPTLLKALSG